MEKELKMKIKRRKLVITGAALPGVVLAGCGGGWQHDIPESGAPAIPGMTLLRTMTLDGTGMYRWGDGTKALQKTPPTPPRVNSTEIPKNVPNGWPGYIEFAQDPLGERGTVMLSSVDPSTPILKNNRSEIYSFSEPARKGTPVVRVYSYGVMVPSESEFVAPDRFFSLQQLHDMPDPGDSARWPNMILMAGAGEFRVYLPLVNPPAQDPRNRVAGRYPLVRNKWYDIRVHINISVENDGWLKVYIDDNLIVDESGHATQYDDTEGPNFKLGVYNIWGHKDNYNLQTGKIARAYFSNCWHYTPTAI
jgi:hypothetical protein